MQISMIAAMAHNRVIGADNDMPWHMPADLKHFKQTTMGKPVIMGRKTFESIGRPLPGRPNIVITSQADYQAEGIHVVDRPLEAVKLAQSLVTEKESEIMVIGGGRIYDTMLAHAHRLYLTFIDATIAGDTQFPDYQQQGTWKEVVRENHEPDANNAHPYTFVTLERIGDTL